MCRRIVSSGQILYLQTLESRQMKSVHERLLGVSDVIAATTATTPFFHSSLYPFSYTTTTTFHITHSDYYYYYCYRSIA